MSINFEEFIGLESLAAVFLAYQHCIATHVTTQP